MVVIKRMFRRETGRRLDMPLRVNIRSNRRYRSGRRSMLRVAETQKLLDGERRPLRHRLRRLIQYTGSGDVNRTL